MYYKIDIYFDFFIRILIACICGFLIGFERENRHKFAGVRTHTIVALGACIGMIISKYGLADSAEFDAARVAAQIVSGIGFLGAGIIFVYNNNVTGLTTAAGIWTTSLIGMAFGAGMYFIGIISSFIILILQTFLYKGEFMKFHYMVYTVIIESKISDTVNYIDKYIENIRIEKESYNLTYDNEKFILSFQFIAKDCKEKEDFIKFLESVKGIDNFKIY